MGSTRKSAINWVVPMRGIIEGVTDDHSPVYLDLDAVRRKCSADAFPVSVGLEAE